MADIFVSYAREDRDKASSFVALLEAQGWTVWWDREINPGLSFSKVIEREIARAKCVIVLWSNHSVSSNWVHAEANDGLEREILIPVLFDSVKVPLVFRQTQAADLTGWPTHPDDQVLQRLFSVISNAIDKPVVKIIPIKNKGTTWKYLASGLGMVTIVLLGYILLNESLPRLPATQDMIRSDSVNPIAEPVASIAVFPFADMENDISIEVAEMLSGTPAIHVIAFNELNKNNVQARFSLQAVQAGNRLLVSLFDNIQQQIRLNQEIDLNDNSLGSAAQIIVSRVAQEFNQPLPAVREVVPNPVYLRYLHASSILRQPLTDSALIQATDELNMITNEAPRFTEAQASLCLAFIESYRQSGEPQEFEKAEKHCFRATRLGDNNPLVKIALGRLYKTGGQLDEATISYEQALSTSPFLTDAISGLASVKLAQGKVEEAVALYKKAQHYEPGSWTYYNQLAELYFRRGDFEAAVEQYQIAKGLVTDQSLVLGNLGSSYFMLEDFENAIVNWEASLLLQTTYTALSNLGSAYYFEGDFEQALGSYEKAIEINGNDYRLWLNAGEAAFHGDKEPDPYYRQSIALAEAQLAINPDEPEILSSLALCYASLGQMKTAQEHINRARAAGNDIYVLYDVAVAYSRFGDTVLMKQTLEKMISNGYSATLIERDANF